jgi:hypothetical protein
VHLNLGQQLHDQRALAAADVELQRALMATRAAGFRHLEGICLESLAGLALDRGELDRSVDTARQAVALAARTGDLTTVAQVGRALAYALQQRGEVAAAEPELRNAIALLGRHDERARLASANLDLARLLLHTGRRTEASRGHRAGRRSERAGGGHERRGPGHPGPHPGGWRSHRRGGRGPRARARW